MHRPWTFEVIYLADAVTFLVPLLLLGFALRDIGGPAADRVADDEGRTRRHRRTRLCCGTGLFAASWP